MKKHKLTQEEYFVLQACNKEYKYITRDKNGTLSVFKTKPPKFNMEWGIFNSDYAEMKAFNHLFKMVKWENDEPTFIKNLLK